MFEEEEIDYGPEWWGDYLQESGRLAQ
ncbi:hypothetical protein PROPHIT492_151 [Mycobacterium phage prophiT49-2]|nr:hypothetical protein PROPHIT492_151 [Mycobacterium phage prophiT49-2]